MRTFVQTGLAVGFCIDAGVAAVALFFQSLLGPQFDEMHGCDLPEACFQSPISSPDCHRLQQTATKYDG